jgi:ankyrin repeat protein
MRLLHIEDDGELSLVERFGTNIPAYAILSHTWGPSNEEVTFQDLLEDTGKKKNGYYKITFCRDQAAKDGLRYFWIDTCCIDKSSSAELAESITSMFRWYYDSAQCYVYLSDVSHDRRKEESGVSCFAWESVFRTSRWFLRGWTLQELLAPRLVKFFSKEGILLGEKLSLEQQIHEITHIPIRALRRAPLYEFKVEERMSWTGKRQTTREEDGAYSLLGIFGISMLPNYGEGKENAFKRLHREIREASDRRFPSLDENHKQMLIDSLRFDQIEARHMTIKTAHTKTCTWLLQSPEYVDWLDSKKLEEHHGFLWIKGKPGAGKSTLMKFALANARKMTNETIVIYFFFNARGEELERSTVGTYRSLLLQLLERLPDLGHIFESLGLSPSNISTEQQWNVELLKALLEKTISSLKGSSVVCFIDALDECDELQIRDMVSFFERIGELAVSSGIRFQTCFSSRHYPHITIRRGLSLVLEGNEGHTQDITNYLASELKIGHGTIAQKIRNDLQDKASGVFMWVALVVSILNQEFDRGRIHALKRRLQEIPTDLHELFHDILTRDSRNKDELLLFIQWVLFARRPLSPEQLYSAVLSGVEPEALMELDPAEITTDVINKFILDSSKGLAEVTASKFKRVQFIHESVRDFLLKDGVLSNIWSEFGSNFRGRSHERLKQCCLTYINDIVARWDGPDGIKSTLEAVAIQLVDFRKSFTETSPFLEYALHNVLYLAEAAQGSGITQIQFLDSFQLLNWVKLTNLIEKREMRKHKESVSLLYVLAGLNLANLIRAWSSAHLCLEVEDERYGCPVFAALAAGNHEAVDACMEGIEKIRATERPYCDQKKRSYQHKYEHQPARRDFNYSKSRGLFSGAAELGHEGVFLHLLESGKYDTNKRDRKGRTPLWWASKNGCVAVVKLLLSIDEIALEGKDGRGLTPLMLVVEQKNYDLAKLLIEHGANVNATGADYYGNVLQVASSSKWGEKIVRLLIENGADVNARGGYFGNALQIASYFENEQTVRLLIDNGADVNAQGGRYGSALQAASSKGDEQIARLLVNKGADVNAQGGNSGSALQEASYKGREQIVRLLVDKGADVNAQGGSYGSALQAASLIGHEQIVRLLLDKGADVNAQGGPRGNALWVASSEGHEQIVRLLLEKGVDVDAEREDYRNALWTASSEGHEQIVRLLLDNGADVDAQGGSRGNALRAASSKGHEQIVRLLLEKGADVNAEREDCRNALWTASSRGHEQIVRLLLEKGADVNANGEHYDNTLQTAIYAGHEQIVRLLVDKGADVNAQRGRYGGALQAASFIGNEKIVRFLVDKGADVNAQGGSYGSALQAASHIGHEQIVRLLLDKGADVNAQGEPGGNALWTASSKDHEQIVRLLLEKGADVNAERKHHGNALQEASYAGYERIVRLLVNKGADVNAQGAPYGGALRAASWAGREQIVRLLVDKGADVNAQGENYGTALQAASYGGYGQTVRFLVDKGADVNSLGGPHGTALQAASYRGYEQIVRFLVDKGADINARGGNCGTALQAASYRGYEPTVRLLVDKGADVNALGGPHGTALQAASYRGYEQIVRFLVDKGADVNALGGPHGTASQAAMYGNNEGIERFLVDKGADNSARERARQAIIS